MLLQIAIGDAYGAGMEYVSTEFMIANNHLQGYCKHPTYHALNPGQYTDDTQMSIGVAEVLLNNSDRLEQLTKRDFIDAFFNAFKRDPRNGYSKQFQSFLENVKSADEFEKTIISDSAKSGGAMRAGPVGLLPTPELVSQVATLQASVTHDTTLGLAAARAVALSVFYCRNNLGPKSELDQYLNQKVPGFKWSEDWSGKITEIGIYHVRAATTLIRKLDNLADILKEVVNFEGDVDTAAAIAMAIGSQSKEIEDNLPQVLIDGLERGSYGFDYLKDLDLQLANRFEK